MHGLSCPIKYSGKWGLVNLFIKQLTYSTNLHFSIMYLHRITTFLFQASMGSSRNMLLYCSVLAALARCEGLTNKMFTNRFSKVMLAGL